MRLVFVLFTPVHDDGLQLQSLAALALQMSSAQARERVNHAPGGDAFWAALSESLEVREPTSATAA